MTTANTEIPFWKKHYPLLAVGGLLLLFVAYKWSDLSLPYFWDEAWSYLPAVMAMIENSPCLLPNCIDPELYRGHPLLFYFLVGTWGKIFGASLWSLHSFALLVAVFAAFSFFRLARFLLGKDWAILAITLLLLQAVFLVQSAMVLPEILLMLATTELLLAYLQQRHWAFVCWGAVLLLTKESGLILWGAVGLYHLIQAVKRPRQFIRDLWWLGAPIVPFALFLLYQKWALGWFLYPLHTGMITFDPAVLQKKTRIVFYFLFLQQGRWLLWALLGLLLAMRNWSKSLWGALLSLLLLGGGVWGIFMPWRPLQLLLLAAVLLGLWLRRGGKKKTNSKPWLMLYGLVFLCFFVFSITNFLMLRYLLCLLPFVLLLALGEWKKLSLNPRYNLGLAILLPLAFLAADFQNREKKWIDDVNLNFSDMIEIHQEVVDYCETQGWQDRNIATHFLMTFNLQNPQLGYLQGPAFTDVWKYYKEATEKPEIVILSAIECHYYDFSAIKMDTSYVKLPRFSKHQAWCDLYVQKSLLQQ